MAETRKNDSGPRAAEAALGATGGAETPRAKAGDSATKFALFVQSKKLDPRRILIASRQIESLQPEDRAIKLGKRKARASEGSESSAKETRKPRSGRPVTDRALQAALAGGALSGRSKTRILRAVNHLLEQKKQPAADLRALF